MQEEYLEYLASLPPEPVRPKPSKRSRGKDSSARNKSHKRLRPPSSTLSSSSWSDDDEAADNKRRKHEADRPGQASTIYDTLWDHMNPPYLVHSNAWKVEDDLVLSFMVKHATEGLEMEGNTSGSDLLIPDGVWVAAAEAFEKGVSNPRCDFDEDEPPIASIPRTAKECKVNSHHLVFILAIVVFACAFEMRC